MKHVWTAADVAWLREQYPARNSKEIAAEFGCTVDALVGAASRFKVRKTKAYISVIARGHGAKPILRNAFIAACHDLLDRLQGTCKSEMVKRTGIHPVHGHSLLSKAVMRGEIFTAGVLAQMRYYSTPEGAELGARVMALGLAARKEEAKTRKRIRDRNAYFAKMELQPPKPPKVKAEKPVKVAKQPKLKQPKPKKVYVPKAIIFAKPKKPPSVHFKDMPAFTPPHVKVQVIPGYTGAPRWSFGE